MKTLKFKHNLVQQILDGSKIVTWRLFDDKNLSVGDKIEFIDLGNDKKFAEVEITKIKEKKLSAVDNSDYNTGHLRFNNQQEMLQHYKELYGEKVSLDTIVKMIEFKLL